MPAEIFGRDAELGAVGDFLDRLRRAPGALVLAGAAGAGKSTLLRAGESAATARGFTVLETTPSRSDLRLAFAGLADLVEPYLGVVAAELSPPQARALRVALLLEEAPSRPPEPRLIAVAFRTVLGLLARSSPVLVVVDDVQWLDPPTEAAVGFGIRRLEHEPVGLLCAQRTTRPGEGLPLELGRARFAAELLPLGGLSLGALHRLLRTRLGTSFSHPVLRRIGDESGGNPLIALEIGRALARRGITSVGTAALPVPDTLSGLVEEHLGALPPAVLDAVRAVAVMPDAPAGRYLAAGVGAAELDAAVVAGVLEADGGRLRFAHPLLASAVAGAIPPARHRELHAVAARTAQRPEERARHRALAATGPSAEVAAELQTAASAAAARGAPATAAELFGLAVSLTPPDQPSGAHRRRLAAARHLAISGETRAARESLEKLVASIPPGPERADALSQLGGLHEDDFIAATALLERALAEAGPDPARAAEIHFSLSEIWSYRGDQALALGEARQALAAAERTGDPARLASSVAQVFEISWMNGAEVDESRLEWAIEVERTTRSSRLRISPAHVAGIYHLFQGRLDEAETELREVLARTEAGGIESWRADALGRLSRIAGRRGDARLAAELAAEGLEIAEQLDLPRPTSAGLYVCAAAALLLGQADTVRELAQRGIDLATRTGDRPFLVCHEALLGSLELALGNYPAAASRFRPLASRLLAVGWHLTTQTIAPDVVETLAAVGELDEAASLLSQVERGMRDPVTAALMARCRGLLAAARGNLGEAASVLAEALRLHGLVSPMPLERGRTLLVLGGVQRRLKQRGAARATMTEAIGIFDGVGAVLWAGRARAELARVSGRAPGPDELTATELRVAELVTRGMTNRQVAAELFVTVRAVESTLTKAYAKLGVRSRTELAARLRGG